VKNFTTRFAALILMLAGFMLPASGWASTTAPAAKEPTQQTAPQPQTETQEVRLAWDRVGSPITPVV
jgi:hypothetical protein